MRQCLHSDLSQLLRALEFIIQNAIGHSIAIRPKREAAPASIEADEDIPRKLSLVGQKRHDLAKQGIETRSEACYCALLIRLRDWAATLASALLRLPFTNGSLPVASILRS